MRETAKVTFYKIKACGFYRRGEDRPDFGSISTLLADLKEWSRGKHLVQTKVFEPQDGQDIHPAYLLDIKEQNGSWVVATWNQTPANEAGVASIKGESSVGDAEIVMNEIDPESIPGFATYFWFLPDRGIFASVRFQHLWTGQKSMQLYLDAFLASFSRHVVFGEKEDADVVVVGYCENPGEPPRNLSPRFRTALEQKPGKKDIIRENATNIRKIIRKSTLQLNRHPDYAWWQTFLHKTHISEPQARPEKVRVQYEISTSVTLQDVNAIISDWDEHHEREWDDYGFTLKGQPNQPLWLSHSLAREEFELDIERNNPEVVNSESLLASLNAAKDRILRILE
ncbi:hypothetical protein [Chromobacterium violaceum]|uniref:Uncharacterized protein n=1 Tax=Chromobacterium violaceum TaxID=536 RepID=A0AAX2MD48_CHRVL|nr:hypothetical protein [Chromobacterium violaceum]OLZ76968.1 hypothetical protein BS642_15180 [Chromobacterium violaceum]STB70173.1 Uncharacterised protein [Chromobacterium violaceum]SUX34817.1 Uncharacterised protein [Chromobacterium violaceum]